MSLRIPIQKKGDGASSSAQAQSTGAVQGTVTDAQGAVVPGATITVRNTATGIERSLVTDTAGGFLATALPPGHYRVEAKLAGFRDQALELDVEVARTTAVNFQLPVGGVAENVSVTASSPVIETTSTSIGQVISQRTVQEIPLNGRHFVDLGLLIPGSVTPPANGFLTAPLRGQGSFAFNTAGNREDTVNFMINGKRRWIGASVSSVDANLAFLARFTGDALRRSPPAQRVPRDLSRARPPV